MSSPYNATAFPPKDEKPSQEHLEDVDHDSDQSPLDRVLAGHAHQMTAEDRMTALSIAQDIDPGPSWNSWRMACFTGYALVTCMCSGDNGFDGTVMSSVNSMLQWQTYFSLGGAASKTGIIFGIYTVGQVVAFFPASYLPDKIGRRRSMFVGNCVLA